MRLLLVVLFALLLAASVAVASNCQGDVMNCMKTTNEQAREKLREIDNDAARDEATKTADKQVSAVATASSSTTYYSTATTFILA